MAHTDADIRKGTSVRMVLDDNVLLYRDAAQDKATGKKVVLFRCAYHQLRNYDSNDEGMLNPSVH